MLQAEDRRARTAQDLATLRAAARSADAQRARLAVRALGRLERPSLAADLLPALRHRLPDVRAEAANAIAQALQGDGTTLTPSTTLATAQRALVARLDVEADDGVQAAICEAVARLPYKAEVDITRAETALVEFAPRAQSSTARLGLAKAFEAFVRLHGRRRAPRTHTVALLIELASADPARGEAGALRDARVRRLALEALIEGSSATAAVVTAASEDPDAQVRRLAVRAALTIDGADSAITRALTDPAPMVQIEALRASTLRYGDGACEPALGAVSDPEVQVSLAAIEQLGACGSSADAVAMLAELAGPSTHPDIAGTAATMRAGESSQRHRRGRAIVALSSAAPERARQALGDVASSRVWQLRVDAARAAAILRDRAVLESLARDDHPNVVEAAISGLRITVGHDADDVYAGALSNGAPQVIRAAARAIAGSSQRDTAAAALGRAWRGLLDVPGPGADAVRSAVRDALVSLGATPQAEAARTAPAAPLTTAELQRLAAPRVRFVIRDRGVFDAALFTMEAPATVLRFAQLVASGYYDGLTFHRSAPNELVEGGSPGANAYVGGAPAMRDEVGLWPHVRGALGMSTHGRDAGDGRFFVNLVDNPRFDHAYTVFAQVLNGIDVVDRILEGDVIERVEILP